MVTKSLDVADFTRALRHLVTNAEQRRKMGVRARQSVVNRTWPDAFQKFWRMTEL